MYYVSFFFYLWLLFILSQLRRHLFHASLLLILSVRYHTLKQGWGVPQLNFFSVRFLSQCLSFYCTVSRKPESCSEGLGSLVRYCW